MGGKDPVRMMEELGILGSLSKPAGVPRARTLNCSELQPAFVKKVGESVLGGYQSWADGVWMSNQAQNSEL